jgi:hypothetical protein
MRSARARRTARPRTVGHADNGPTAVARDAIRRDGAGRDRAWRDRAWRDRTWRDRTWREPAWRASVRASRRAEPLLPGWHLARTTKQLTVVVFLGVYRPAWPGGIVLLGGGRVAVIGRIGFRAVAEAIPLAPG